MTPLYLRCDEFILMVRERRYPGDLKAWPAKCGTVFSRTPLLTGMGTCFIVNPEYSLKCVIYHHFTIEK